MSFINAYVAQESLFFTFLHILWCLFALHWRLWGCDHDYLHHFLVKMIALWVELWYAAAESTSDTWSCSVWRTTVNNNMEPEFNISKVEMLFTRSITFCSVSVMQFTAQNLPSIASSVLQSKFLTFNISTLTFQDAILTLDTPYLCLCIYMHRCPCLCFQLCIHICVHLCLPSPPFSLPLYLFLSVLPVNRCPDSALY